jgi:hypothetical protein
LAQPGPGVYARGGGGLGNNLHLGLGKHHPIPQAVDVPSQAGHPMAIDSAQIGGYQHVSRDAGVLLLNAELFKHPHAKVLQRLCPHPHSGLLWHFSLPVIFIRASLL